MITLLHGDHIEASRSALNALKEAGIAKELRNVDGRTVEESSLVQSLESSSLFGGDTLVVIDRLFSKIGRQTKRIEALCKLLVQSSDATDVILWEDKEVGATVIKHLGSNAQVRVFKVPVLIFQFLDGIKPNNVKNTLSTYSQLVQSDAPELIFSMMVKRVRQLIQVFDGATPEGVAAWQAGRLMTQAKSFTMEKLLLSYKSLHDIEVRIKTGMSPYTLSAHIEQFIISL
jgi:DNA polymerase III delta subunit